MTDNYDKICGTFEFKTDRKNGFLIGPDGAHYANERCAMYYGQLGFCRCGDPCGMHEFVIQCLENFDNDKLAWDDPAARLAGVKAAVEADPQKAAELIAYVLDQHNLTTHGGSIHGAWLTDRGKQFLAIGAMSEDDDDA